MKNYKLILMYAVILIGVLVLLRYWGLENISPVLIQGHVQSFGLWAPLVFILFYGLRPLLLFPASILTIVAGMTFGIWMGTLYVVIGATLGACLAFLLTRKLGRKALENWLGNKFPNLGRQTENYGFITVLLMRLLPIVPFDAISYGAGLSGISFRHYTIATLIGMLPGTFAYTLLGNSLHHVFSPAFYLALGLVALLLVIPVVYKKFSKAAVNTIKVE